jgi:three-Cys-motif partner protein
MTPGAFDEIGYWSELKLEIVKKYASAYSSIITAQGRFHHLYVDGFAGAGVHISRTSRVMVPGSPLNALEVTPPFREYHLIDMNADRVAGLRDLVGDRRDVHFYTGDSNQILLERVFPLIRYEAFRRGLVLLDPYGLHLDWQVVETAGQLGTIDMFLNFPVMDMNRNVLWERVAAVDPADAARMTAFWGDDSWRRAAYTSVQGNLFGAPRISSRARMKMSSRPIERACGRWRDSSTCRRRSRCAILLGRSSTTCSLRPRTRPPGTSSPTSLAVTGRAPHDLPGIAACPLSAAVAYRPEL